MRLSHLGLLVALSLLGAGVLHAADATASRDPDPKAALIEIVPPAAITQSPAAVELTDRLMRKHMLLLSHPSLLKQVLQKQDVVAPELRKQADPVDHLARAIRVRPIPQTNIIELSIDQAVAGERAAALAEAIVDQHLENQQVLRQNVDLERSVMLNNLKQRYQFRKDELNKDLHEKMVRLSIDGMGMPGRLSAREVELQQMLQLRFDLERKKEEANADKKTVDAQLKQLNDRIDTAKADLGELTNSMNHYLTLKDEESTTRELLRQVNDQLEKISQNMNATPQEARWLCRPSRG